MSPEAALAIAGMALVTYGVRAAGFLLAAHVPTDGFAAAWMRHLPAAVLMAIVAPNILTAGPADGIAAAVTVGVAAATRNLFAAMGAGVAAAWLGRSMLPPGLL